MKNTSIIWFLLILSIVKINAQNPLIKHFTQKDGLPSNVVYDVCQDLKGFIWIATDKGLVRYDGVQFKKYGLADRLPTNDIFKIQMDDEGTLWFDAFGYILYRKEGEFRTSEVPLEKWSDSYVYILINKAGVFAHICDSRDWSGVKIEDEKIIYLSRPEHFITCTFPNQALVQHSITKKLPLKKNENILENDSKNLTVIIDSTEFSITPKKSLFYFVDQPNSNKKLIFNNHLIGSRNDSFYIVKNVESSKKFSSEFPNLFENKSLKGFQKISDSLLLIQLKDRNIVMDSSFQIVESHSFLSNININRLRTDRNNNYWITSDLGLYFVNHQYLSKNKLFIDFIDVVVASTLINQDELFILGLRGSILKYKNGSLEVVRSNKYENYNYSSIVTYDSSVYVAGFTISELQVKNNTYVLKSGLDPRSFGAGHIKDISVTKDGFYIASGYGAYFIDVNRENQHLTYSKKRSNYISVSDNVLCWTGKYGIECKYINSPNDTILLTIPLINNSITSMTLLSENQLWFGLQSGGLFKYSFTSNESSIIIDNIEVINISLVGNELWVATNKGIVNISDPSGIYKINWFDTSHGLPYNGVNEVLVSDKHIYARTGNILTILDKDKTNFEIKPFYITNVKVNNIDTAVIDNYTLDPNKNSLEIEFALLDFQKLGEIPYEYRLLPNEDNWQPTFSNRSSFQYLVPGNYTFQVRPIGESY